MFEERCARERLHSLVSQSPYAYAEEFIAENENEKNIFNVLELIRPLSN